MFKYIIGGIIGFFISSISIIYFFPLNKNSEFLTKIKTIDYLLNQQYYFINDIDKQKHETYTLFHYVDFLGDPYTEYLPQKYNKEIQNSLEQSYSTKDEVTINSTGLIEQIAIERLKSKFSGYNVLSNNSGGKINLKDFIEFKEVKIESKGYTYIWEGNKYGYIRIPIVNKNSYNIFKSYINEFPESLSGIIIDLRDNHGGILNDGISIVSNFVSKNSLLLIEKFKNQNDKIVFSPINGKFKNTPIVFIVNKETASAAEVIVLSLLGIRPESIKVIGEKTYGKGTMQNIYEFGDGSSFKYTIGKWYNSLGQSINSKGIQPDIQWDYDKYKEDIIEYSKLILSEIKQ